MALLFISLSILIAGLVFFFFFKKREKSFGSLSGNRIYQDTQSQPGMILSATSIPLSGKPDYLIKEKSVIIPVEVKTGKTPIEPYMNHTMQVLAYCYLVEENFGIRPPGGIIKYPEKEFKVAYTDDGKRAVEELVQEILQAKESNEEFHCKHDLHYTYP